MMESWRKSIRKSLAKRVSLHSQREDTLSNEIVKYKGVSLEALNDLWSKVLDRVVVPETKLFVTRTDVQDVRKGTTICLVQGNSFFVPYRKDLLTAEASLLEFKERQDWSIEDVCEHVVLPLTLEKKAFYIDLIESKHVGKAFQGAFVSQARKSSFGGLLTAINKHYESRGKKACEVFLWLDLFSANQPLLTGKDPTADAALQQQRWDLLTHGLHHALFQFDERLIFFNSWDDPYPLQRAWCIWEIYGAAASGKALDIIFDPSASQDVVEKLMSNPDSLLQAIADMDPQKMECHDEKDLEMIRHAVEQLEGGFSALKAKITERLRRWLLVTVEDAVKQQDNESGSHQNEAFADLLNHAGQFMEDMDEKEVALSYYERAKDVFVKVYGGERHEAVAIVFGNMGNVYSSQGKPKLALEMHEKALEITKETLGEDDLATASSYHNIASVYDYLGKYELALKMYEKVLEITKETLGERHSSTADTYNNMAIVYESQGKYELALEMYEKALAIYKETLGERHPNTAQTWKNIAIVYEAQGKHELALEVFEKVLEVAKETLGERHPTIADTYNNMAIAYDSQGRYEKALEMYEKALEIRKETLGERHLTTADTYNNMAVVYEAEGKYELALEMYEKALEITKEILGESHPSTADIYNNMAIVYESQRKNELALELYEKAIEIKKETLGERHPSMADTFNNIGLVYENQGKYGLSLEMYEKALEIYKETWGERHPSTAAMEENMGLVFEKQGKIREAHEKFSISLRIRQETLGTSHPLTQESQQLCNRTIPKKRRQGLMRLICRKKKEKKEI